MVAPSPVQRWLVILTQQAGDIGRRVVRGPYWGWSRPASGGSAPRELSTLGRRHRARLRGRGTRRDLAPSARAQSLRPRRAAFRTAKAPERHRMWVLRVDHRSMNGVVPCTGGPRSAKLISRLRNARGGRRATRELARPHGANFLVLTCTIAHHLHASAPLSGPASFRSRMFASALKRARELASRSPVRQPRPCSPRGRDAYASQ